MSVQVFLQIAGLKRLIAPGKPDGKFTRVTRGLSHIPGTSDAAVSHEAPSRVKWLRKDGFR
jgi:hypothetical protein